MALLERAPPQTAFFCMDLLTRILEIPNPSVDEPAFVNKHACSALSKNPAVVVPLVRYAIANVALIPTTDLEDVSADSIFLIRLLFNEKWGMMRIACLARLPVGG